MNGQAVIAHHAGGGQGDVAVVVLIEGIGTVIGFMDENAIKSFVQIIADEFTIRLNIVVHVLNAARALGNAVGQEMDGSVIDIDLVIVGFVINAAIRGLRQAIIIAARVISLVISLVITLVVIAGIIVVAALIVALVIIARIVVIAARVVAIVVDDAVAAISVYGINAVLVLQAGGRAFQGRRIVGIGWIVVAVAAATAGG